MASRIWLKREAIAKLAGYSVRKVWADSKKWNWPWTTDRNSKVRLFDAAAVAKTYNTTFTPEAIAIVARKLNRVAVLIED